MSQTTPPAHEAKSLMETLKAIDYNKMRSEPRDHGTHHADDETLLLFITTLNYFFTQASSNLEVFQAAFKEHMPKIIRKISDAEYSFCLEKYNSDPSWTEYTSREDREQMANDNRVTTIDTLRKRMQYWAAGASWGDTIRNPEQHKQATDHLKSWGQFFCD